MGQYTQDKRLISVETSLGKDELLLTAFDGEERISDTFSFQLRVLSVRPVIKPEDIVGKPVSVTIHTKTKREFSGFVSHFVQLEPKEGEGLREYQLTMVPWLWFLCRTESRRIFQNKNTKEIVSDVFKKLGFSDFEFRAEGGKKREYCVQYGESDLNFISRLLEEDGIGYYFKHTSKKHTMVLVDKANAYEDCAETNLTYARGALHESHISRWQHHYEFTKGVWTLNDYNFKTPDRVLLDNAPTVSKYANVKNYEHYEYPGLYDTDSGKTLANIRMQAEEVQINTVHGESTCATFYAGGKFTLKTHEVKSELGSYVLTSVNHSAREGSYFANQETATGYNNYFNCIPADVHYRPARRHEKPCMRGPQSAVVTGKAGEEIYIDEFGRIKVQFIWDREGKKDENTTCFLRVMQSWAGNQWGSWYIPRIGHEVIVTFLDGDPDRPIVTGTVYNGKNKTVYNSGTVSGVKTRSTKGGTADNFNEIRLEDKKGAEQIFIHAEKNMDTEVENDETHTVDHDRTKTIKHDENSFINHDRNKTVDNNQTETIGKDKSIRVGDNHTEDIGKNMTIRIGQDLKEVVKGKYLENVTEEYDCYAKTITMTAKEKITLQTGSAKIVMESNGNITISGATINVKGSGNVIIKGSKVLSN